MIADKIVVTGDHSVKSVEAGFTLLEVIVSLAILAASLSVIFYTVSTSVGRTSQSETLTHARLLAQSILARVGNEIPVSLGETTGRDDHGYRWRLQQKAYGPNEGIHRGIPVLEVTIEVSWGQALSSKSIEISTLRLASRQISR